MRTCKKCRGMMFPERVIDMLEGLVGHFYACVNCSRREDAEEAVQYLCKERPYRVLNVNADHQFREKQGCLMKEKREVAVGAATGFV